jgi:hypothetical protein
MIQTQRKEIGGVSVAVTPFPFTVGYPLALRWAKIITPVVGPLIKGVMAEVQAKGMSIEALMGAVEANPLAAIAILDLDRLADALEKLAASINPHDFAELSVQTLASAAVTMAVEGRLTMVELQRPGMIDLAFSGRYRLSMQVLAFAAWVNFGSFFSDAITRDGKSAAPATGILTPSP